jgi:hypothetical protein
VLDVILHQRLVIASVQGLLWENEESKNQMISEFFSQQFRSNSSGLFSIESTQIQNIENTLYENFYNMHKSAFLEKAVEQVSQRVSTNTGNSSTKYAFEDDTWLMKRGLKKQVLDTELELGKEVDKKLSLLCMDHIPDLDVETAEKLVKAQGNCFPNLSFNNCCCCSC